MAGLPIESWILIGASVGVGLALELLFLRARRAHRPGRHEQPERPGPSGPDPESDL